MKFLRAASALGLLLISSAVTWAEESYFGIFLNGAKLGYAVSSEAAVKGPGAAVVERKSLTVLRSTMLGNDLDIRQSMATFLDKNGRPTQMRSEMDSAGRTMIIEAQYKASTVEVISTAGGVVTKRSLPIPAGATVVDDPTSVIALGAVTSVKNVHVLDPTTLTLVANRVSPKGRTKVMVKGAEFDADLVEIDDTRAITRVFLSAKGDVIKIEAPFGVEMLPQTKEEALLMPDGARPDLALETTIKVTPTIERPRDTESLVLHVSGVDLSRIPRDGGQTVERTTTGFRIGISPLTSSPAKRTRQEELAVPISKLSARHPEYRKPTLHIPSDDSSFKKLAKSVIGAETNSYRAAQKISKYVDSLMHPNAGIGVLRDANEILKTKEGVCRDYAILTATLMRSVGIPTRVVSGLIFEDGAFYYHAWVEAFTGAAWVPFDSTRSSLFFDATHLKLAQGHVEDAFLFKVFEKAEVRLERVTYRK